MASSHHLYYSSLILVYQFPLAVLRCPLSSLPGLPPSVTAGVFFLCLLCNSLITVALHRCKFVPFLSSLSFLFCLAEMLVDVFLLFKSIKGGKTHPPPLFPTNCKYLATTLEYHNRYWTSRYLSHCACDSLPVLTAERCLAAWTFSTCIYLKSQQISQVWFCCCFSQQQLICIGWFLDILISLACSRRVETSESSKIGRKAGEELNSESH